MVRRSGAVNVLNSFLFPDFETVNAHGPHGPEKLAVPTEYDDPSDRVGRYVDVSMLVDRRPAMARPEFFAARHRVEKPWGDGIFEFRCLD